MSRLRLLAALAALIALVPACSKDQTNNPTGGGGTVLNLSLAAGGVAHATFPSAETVRYKCGLHASMDSNTVIVDAASPNTDANVTVVNTPVMDFSPRSVTIRPGGSVHWSNPSGLPHTIVNE